MADFRNLEEFAIERLLGSPLHQLLGRPNLPRDGDLKNPFFETLEVTELAPPQS